MTVKRDYLCLDYSKGTMLKLPPFLKDNVLKYWWAQWRQKNLKRVVAEYHKKFFPVILKSTKTLVDGSVEETEIFYALCCQDPIQLVEVPGYNFRRLGGGFLAYSHSIWRSGGKKGWINLQKLLPTRYLYSSGLPHSDGWF